MTLREMLIEKIVEFQISSKKTIVPHSIAKMTDEDLLDTYRNNVWDEAYVDGHVEGYCKGVDTEREESKQIDSKVRLN